MTGAAGTLGSYVVQLAKHAGIAVIADAAAEDRDFVESLGADHVVDRGQDVANRILALFPGGVDGLADTAVQNEQVLRAVRPNGSIAVVRGWDTADAYPVNIHEINVRDYYQRNDRLAQLRRLVEDGKITLRVAGVLPAEDAAEAHKRLEGGGVRGRIVLTF